MGSDIRLKVLLNATAWSFKIAVISRHYLARGSLSLGHSLHTRVDGFDSDDRQFYSSRDLTATRLCVDARHKGEGGVTKRDSGTGRWVAGRCQLPITAQNLRTVCYKKVNVQKQDSEWGIVKG